MLGSVFRVRPFFFLRRPEEKIKRSVERAGFLRFFPKHWHWAQDEEETWGDVFLRMEEGFAYLVLPGKPGEVVQEQPHFVVSAEMVMEE